MGVYNEFYGLREAPFNITPDPRFLYFSPRHRDAFDQLRYGIEERRGFIELIGEVGAGKTTLCRAVLSQLPKSVLTALVLNPSLSGTQLMRAILHDLGLPARGKDRLGYIEQLNDYLLRMSVEGFNVAVFIDEAQNLSPETMEQVRLLSNLETDQHKLMQIVLVGQPELDTRLGRHDLRQLRQRIMVRCRLHPLNEEETAGYIAHRLRVAGAGPEVTFAPDAVHLVFHHAQGIPRITNTICDRTLLAGYVDGAHTLNSGHVRQAIEDFEHLGLGVPAERSQP
jgi:general secretion pathway protein A